jgi:hypothetical protein
MIGPPRQPRNIIALMFIQLSSKTCDGRGHITRFPSRTIKDRFWFSIKERTALRFTSLLSIDN